MTDALLGHPWGYGAVKVRTPEKGWVCPECSSKPSKDAGAHTMPDGREICSGCARRGCESPTVTISYRGEKWYTHCSLHGLIGRFNTTEAFARERAAEHEREHG